MPTLELEVSEQTQDADAIEQQPAQPLCLLFITLEYLGPLFSGNGVYSRALVAALKGAGARVMVISGRSAATAVQQQDAAAFEICEKVLDIPLPTWGNVDASADWQGFAAGCGQTHVVEAAACFQPSVVCYVDWSGAIAWEALRQGAATATGAVCSSAATAPFHHQLSSLGALPACFLNFRVFSTSPALHHTREIAAFYRAREAAAVKAAAVAVALCRADAASIAALALGFDPLSGARIDASGAMTGEPSQGAEDAGAALATDEGEHAHAAQLLLLPSVCVLLPPLRRAIEALAREGAEGRAVPLQHAPPSAAIGDAAGGVQQETTTQQATANAEGLVHPPAADAASSPLLSSPHPQQQRTLLTSVVRLSPEKGTHRFAELVARLAEGGQLCPRGADAVVPWMGGAVGDKAYAEALTTRMVSACAAACVAPHAASTFLGPPQLKDLFSRTLLNVHPALADAYGMTVVEAAAFGAPSLVHVPAVGVRGAAPVGGGSAVAPVSFVPGLPNASASAGFLRMVWHQQQAAGGNSGRDAEDSATAAGSRVLPSKSTKCTTTEPLGRQLLRMRFPPVGACDLLAPSVVGGGSPPGDGSPAAAPCAVIPIDFEASEEAVAAAVGGLIGGQEGRAKLAAVGAAARTLALSWTEAHSSRALHSLLLELVRVG